MSSPAIQHPQSRATGTLLITVSAIIWSTAGLFTKSVSADVWTILFWRGVFSAGFIFAWLAWSQGRSALQDIKKLGAPGWGLAAIGAASTVCFIAAFKHTSVANVGIIYATVPFIAAILAWVAMREAPSRATVYAAAAALIGALIMVAGSLGTPNLTGDGLALLMTFGMALKMVMIRKYAHVPMVMAGAFSSVLLVVIAPFMTNPFDISLHDLIWLIGFGSVFAAGIILLTLGTRLIPAAQSALISALETPLAPLWAWLLLSELPPAASWLGGAIVLAAVLWNIKADRRSSNAA